MLMRARQNVSLVKRYNSNTGHKSEFYFYSAVDVGAEQIIVQMKQFEFVEIRFRLVIRLMG